MGCLLKTWRGINAELLVLGIFSLSIIAIAQRHHISNARDDTEKLQKMACKIRLGMSREEVERELGKPRHSRDPEMSYSSVYPVGSAPEGSIQLGLVVNYTIEVHRQNEPEEYTDRVEEYFVGRGKWFLLESDSDLHEPPAAQHRESHDLRESRGWQRLQDEACRLRIGMSRKEVELQIGKPEYSPIRGQYYYFIDPAVTDETGIPFGIVVEYRRFADDIEKDKYTGNLENYLVGRIGE